MDAIEFIIGFIIGLILFSVLTTHIFKKIFNEDCEYKTPTLEERFKEQIKQRRIEAEIETLRMRNTVLSVYAEMQDRDRRMSNADAQRHFDCSQCCQFSFGPMRDTGTAEVVREIKGLPKGGE